jgi:hypothetical protein
MNYLPQIHLNFARPLRTSVALALLAIGWLATLTESHATVVPGGLSIGDPYYLAFVTENNHPAGSSSISTYNAFVQSEAALNPSLTGTSSGVTYNAIASTFGTNVKTNMGLTPGVPVYLLDGATVVSTVDGIGWLGSSLNSAINITQYGTAPVATPIAYPYVWTGTDPNGDTAVNPLDGPFAPRMGTWFFSTTDWVSYSNTNVAATLRFYGISSLLHVPAVPEPSSLVIAICSVSVLFRRSASIR